MRLAVVLVLAVCGKPAGVVRRPMRFVVLTGRDGLCDERRNFQVM